MYFKAPIVIVLLLSTLASCKQEDVRRRATQANNRAIEALMEGDHTRVEDELIRAISIDDDYYLPHLSLVKFYRSTYRYEEALDATQMMIAKFGEDPMSLLYRALLLEETERESAQAYSDVANRINQLTSRENIKKISSDTLISFYMMSRITGDKACENGILNHLRNRKLDDSQTSQMDDLQSISSSELKASFQ